MAKTVRFHSSQDRISQSTATNVFQSINHKAEEAQVAADLVEEAAAEAALTEDHEKCTKQHAETVAKIVRFHSSQSRISQSIAANVFKVIKETRSILV